MAYWTDTGGELVPLKRAKTLYMMKSQRQSKINSVHAASASLCYEQKYFCVSGGIAATLDSDQGLNPDIVCYSKHMKRPRRNCSHVKRARTRAKVLHTVKVKLTSFLKLSLNRKTPRNMVSI